MFSGGSQGHLLALFSGIILEEIKGSSVVPEVEPGSTIYKVNALPPALLLCPHIHILNLKRVKRIQNFYYKKGIMVGERV